MKRIRAILITNVISPYRVPVFNHLAKQHDIDLIFVFLRPMLRNLRLRVPWHEIAFNYRILKGKEINLRSKELTLHFNIGFLKLLIKTNPDAIASLGYSYIETIIGLIYSKLRNKKFILLSGSTLISSRSKNIAIRKVKEMIIKGSDSFLTYGSDAAAYLVHHGAKKEKIVISCNTVDVQKFISESKKVRSNLESIKREFNLPEFNILFSGQLIARKNLLTLLNAFKLIDCPSCGLLVLGDGPQREEYVRYSITNNIKNVFFGGHQDFRDLVKFYAVSDVFVLPSYREVWGLAVNEAMACGLPVICSNRAGVGTDLVKEGINGYTFDPYDLYALKEKLMLLINNRRKSIEMGRKSQEIIINCTPERYADDVLKAIYLAFW